MFLSRLLQKFFGTSKAQQDDEHSARVRLELALEAADMVDWDFDYEKNTAHRTIAHDKLYGYTEFLPNWNFEHFFHHVLPEFHELAKSQFESLTHVDNIAFDYKIRRVDGAIRWISLKGRGQRDKNGKLLRVAGVLKDITEQKNSEEKVNLQMKNIQSLFNDSPEFFCIFRKDLSYEYVNPAHVKLFQGRNLTGLTVEDAQPEMAGSEFVDALRRIFITGETITFRDTYARIGDRDRYLDLVYTPKRNALNEIDGIMTLGSDVTDKVMALKQAEKSAAHMRLITDKLPAFISYTDNQGRYQFMNQMYEKWFERPVSEMLGKTRQEITPPEYAIQSRPYESKALHGSPSHHEGIIFKENGDFLNLDINFVSDVDPVTQEVRGIIAVGVDITARTQALKEAELARKELHEVFMQAPAPMCLLTGPEHIFAIANPKYVELVGRDVQGKTLREAFTVENIKYYSEIIEKVYQTGEPHFVTQAPLELHDEQGKLFRKYINVGYHAYKESTGQVKGVLVIVLDVTEQVNSVIARDNFISIASHELKTPITALKLQMQMNLKQVNTGGLETFSTERLVKIFSGTVSQINRLTRLVDDMLDGSRFSAENLNMNFTPVNFSQLVSETFENYDVQFRDVGITVSSEIQEDIILRLDEARMEQVLINLITNAIRYAPHKPLQVGLSIDHKSAVLRIRDEGIGIEEKYHEKIFDQFERVDTGRDVSGLGLGLYISRKIVQNHGGKISVSSQLGKGSEFVIKIPLL